MEQTGSPQNTPIDLSNVLKKKEQEKAKTPSPWREESVYISPYASRMVRWVIIYSGGLVKTEKEATYVLIGFVIAGTMIAFYFFLFGGGGVQLPSEEEIFRLTPPPPGALRP